MQHFIISPSEAFLIGCCVGEYREARRDNEYADFPYFLITRLRPFVPDLVTVTSSIATDEVPHGLEWFENEAIGIAFDDSAVYRRQCEQVTKTSWNRSRKTLVDLIAELIFPYVAWSRFAQSALPLPGMEKAGQIGLFSIEWLYNTDDDVNGIAVQSLLYTPTKPDNEDELTAAIEALIRDEQNNLLRTYQDGQIYGKLLAAVERVKVTYLTYFSLEENEPWYFDYRNGDLLWRPFDFDDDLWRDYHRAVDEVAECGISAKLSHVRTICENERQRTEPNTSEITLGYASSVARAECAVRTAVGIVLGSFRDEDNEAHWRNARSAVPRAFILGTDANADRIGGQIEVIGQFVDDRLGIGAKPEQIVVFAENVIEGLAKGLWPGEFARTGREGTLRNILLEHRRLGTELEKRFSDIALPLYDQYRGRAQHQLRDFQCSWTEARFFYLGIQTLAEIHKGILEERNRR